MVAAQTCSNAAAPGHEWSGSRTEFWFPRLHAVRGSESRWQPEHPVAFRGSVWGVFDVVEHVIAGCLGLSLEGAKNSRSS